MEKTITLNDKEYKFKLTAATTYLYRQKFGKDLIREFQRITKSKKGDIPDSAVDTLSEVAYIAAKQADRTITDDPAEWMDQFSLMDFYNVILPAVSALWQESIQTTVKPKK